MTDAIRCTSFQSGTGARRIASLVPSLSELVATWGLADRLVAVTDYCTEPPDALAGATRIRGTKNPNVARIISLGPDVVLADQEENRRIDIERLRSTGINVYVTRVRSVGDVAEEMRRLGGILGVEDAGRLLRDEILAALASSRNPTPASRPPSSVACMIWRDGARRGAQEHWWVVGERTYAGDLLRSVGLEPIAVGADDRYPRVDLADIRAADPDLILLPDEPYRFSEEDAAVFVDWRADVRLCPGQELFWWGPRTPGAIRWLADLRTMRGHESVRRANPRNA